MFFQYITTDINDTNEFQYTYDLKDIRSELDILTGNVFFKPNE